MARGQRRSFTRDFKLAALKRMAETNDVVGLAREVGIERRLLYTWRKAFAVNVAPGLRRACRPTNAEKAELAEALSRGESPLDESEPEIAALGRKVGEQAMALDIFREALPHVREKRRLSGVSGETDPTT